MLEENSFENGKIAVALRAARAAIGWNQDEFATLMGVAKSTIARIETLEMAAKGEFVNRAMRLFRDAGVALDLYDENILPLTISRKAVLDAIARLQDEGRRRSDRLKSGVKMSDVARTEKYRKLSLETEEADRLISGLNDDDDTRSAIK